MISQNGVNCLRALAVEGLDMIQLEIDRDGDVDGYCETCGAHLEAPEWFNVKAIMEWALAHSALHRVVIPGRIVERTNA